MIKVEHPQAVFFDRDGTLITEEPYLNEASKVKLEKNVGETLGILTQKNIPIIIITNQSGIGRGIIQIKNLIEIHQKLQALLSTYHATIKDILYCPHHPQKAQGEFLKECECRKPKAGLIYQACSKYNFDPKKCWFVGDRLSDMQASYAAQCKSFWVQSGLAYEYKPEQMPKFTTSIETVKDIVSFL